jgi:hypothetical protein
MDSAKRHRHVIVVPALLFVIVTVLTGCGTGKSLATRTTATPTPWPTATLRPTATPLATAASTVGWVVYHDPRYPFQVPVPPQWQVAASTDSTPATTCTWYEANVFPPGRKPVLSGPITEVNQEVILISFQRDCPPADPVRLGWGDPLTSITISGFSTMLYGSTSPYGGDIPRIAVLTLGGSECHFYMQSPVNTAKRDLSVFLGMLSGFKYAGQ